jgi:hypothetical protein
VTIWEWLTAVLRRWPVLLVGMLCTISIMYAIHKRPVSFQACGSIIVGAPATPTSPNVYNNTEGSLVAATGLITEELQSATVQSKLRAEGATGAFQAQVHNTGTTETPAYSEPEMDVCATSTDPGVALGTSNAVLAEFDALLRSREVAAHVPAQFYLTEKVLASPGSVAETGRPSQAYLAVFMLGAIVTVAAALWTDQYLRRRKLRRRDHDYAAQVPIKSARHARDLR